VTSGLAPAPAVSVLLTSYNRERYIAESIESVLSQSFEDFELVISDNRSTDRTLEIVREYATRDPRIRVFVNESNIGQFGNRRKAASLARGRFLKYHDSDDVMYRHCLAAMVEPLDAEPRAALALSASHYWPGGPCPMLLTPALAYEREYFGGGLFHLGPSCALFRTEAFEALGGFPDRGVASDYLFWLETCARVSVLLVPADLFYYRVHPDQEFADPRNEEQYARATSAAWDLLNSPVCPLSQEAREQAKRNLAYTVARGMYRHFRGRRPSLALAHLRYSGLRAGDWLRYLRPPRRRVFAGTPPVEDRLP
jgi:glycosyltransferase involved in cell wall biosynthesis